MGRETRCPSPLGELEIGCGALGTLARFKDWVIMLQTETLTSIQHATAEDGSAASGHRDKFNIHAAGLPCVTPLAGGESIPVPISFSKIS